MPQPGQSTTTASSSASKRSASSDSETSSPTQASREPKKSKALHTINDNEVLVRPKPTRTATTIMSLPPEVIQKILVLLDRVTRPLFSLTCEYITASSVKVDVSCPQIKGRYQLDLNRIRFMKHLQHWTSENVRLCWACRKFKPIQGGAMALWEMDGLPIKKKEGLSRQDRDKYVKLEHESRDEDWNFLSLGACKFKDRKVHIRTFCPKCTVAIHSISTSGE